MISEIFESEKGKLVCQRRTICEIHREIFDILIVTMHDRPEALKKAIKPLEDAFVMGIKLNKRLVECKIKTTYDINVHFESSKKRREERKRLMTILNHNKDFLNKYA